jgi:hypothetical protein
MPSATSATSPISAARRPIASWTIRTLRPSCRYRLPVRVFAIEVRLAAFVIGKITAAFEGNGLLAFSAWLRWRTLTASPAFASRTLA